MPPHMEEPNAAMMETSPALADTTEQEAPSSSSSTVKEESQRLWDEISIDTDPETASDEEATTTTTTTTEEPTKEEATDTNSNTNESHENGQDKPAAPKFGSRFENFNQSMKERWQARQARLREESAQPFPAVVVKPKEEAAAAIPTQALTISEAEKEFLQPSKISVTVMKETRDSKWGFGIAQHETEPDTVVIKAIVDHGLLRNAPFQEGYTLKTVNNQKSTNSETTIQELVKFEGNTQITLTAETPNGNPQLVQAFVRKPSERSLVGIGFYNTTHSGGQRILQINHLDPAGLLAHSALSQGDLVLSINGKPCSQMDADEAAQLILATVETVTIAALRPKNDSTENRAQGWMRQAKRAGVAIGGGAMVGVGLIFIPTLPPPFGEVLIVGGVSVLGTEFEAPKRVMKSARDRLENAVGREEKTAESKEGGNEKEPTEGEREETVDASGEAEESSDKGTGDETDKEAPPKKTMGGRFKNFGRNYVLPFLDQVVGDRKPEDDNAGPITPVLSIPDSDDEDESSPEVPENDLADNNEEQRASSSDETSKPDSQIPESDGEAPSPAPDQIRTEHEPNTRAEEAATGTGDVAPESS
jgi:C-terminal processing protease CtpA/Prc